MPYKDKQKQRESDMRYYWRNRDKRMRDHKEFVKRMKLEHRCIDCGVPLPEDDNQVVCINCYMRKAGLLPTKKERRGIFEINQCEFTRQS